jgi:hypothetical protein
MQSEATRLDGISDRVGDSVSDRGRVSDRTSDRALLPR